ncbi:hypothetical protein HanXRQr2_Chr14g0634841 [Helianthus annuus]|uniref:Uncharacterized protein n=1 Tax=Helianthus annuus TaxID=4232 RepID=A0A9K3E7M8_HELAN|nr:hypothetical protein HanXRQr2_Chr14g0634841 [Helianthus annuus]
MVWKILIKMGVFLYLFIFKLSIIIIVIYSFNFLRVNFHFTLCGLVVLTVLSQSFKNSHFSP